MPAASAPDRLADFDFAAHNGEIKRMWAAYQANEPFRTPIIFGLNTRYFILNRALNTAGVTFRDYSEDPDVMFDTQLAFARWSRFNLLQDMELGVPSDAWTVHVDFQNYYEAAWFGCPVEYLNGEVPDTRPSFADSPEVLFDRGLPDPFASIMVKVKSFQERFAERAARETFFDRPIKVMPGSGTGSDGIFTTACNLFSPEVVCMMMMEEPARLHRLLDFITRATIGRMLAWRKRHNQPTPVDNFWFADDSIALISTAQYRQHVLPWHRRIYDTFATSKGRAIHLCGDATRHFVTLRDELDIRTFDTGFPVDFARLRRELGPGVRIMGGPHVQFLRQATPPQVRGEVNRIMTSGVLDGGMFVLREGNNLAPHTPLENTEALYRAGREFGTLRGV